MKVLEKKQLETVTGGMEAVLLDFSSGVEQLVYRNGDSKMAAFRETNPMEAKCTRIYVDGVREDWC